MSLYLPSYLVFLIKLNCCPQLFLAIFVALHYTDISLSFLFKIDKDNVGCLQFPVFFQIRETFCEIARIHF